MATKRPHYVPRTYLVAWANTHGQVAYRRRDGGDAVVTSTRNVAVQGGIYGGELAQLREQFFQQVEGEWTGLRRELVVRGDLRGERRSLLALFAAIQLMRTLKHSNRANFISGVAATTADRPISRDAVRRYLFDLDGAEPDDDEVEALWTISVAAPGILTPDEMLGVSMDVAVTQVAPRLEQRDWAVNRFDEPALMSNDCPVHTWRRPTADAPIGGIGVENADEVRFPLTPSTLLAMTRPGRPVSQASQEPRQANAEVFRGCHQFVIGIPQSKPALDRLELSPRPPRLRFRTAPEHGDAVQMYVE